MNQFLAEPQQPHLNTLKQILKYLKGTIDCGILYKKGHNVDLEAFVDFNWVSDLESRRSTSGYFRKI